MHEAAVVEGLVKLVAAKAEELDARSVTRISLVVGELTGYMEESLRFYLGIFAKGTRLDGAELSVTYVKPKLRCPTCDLLFERPRYSFDCPGCGTAGVMTKIGSEFYVESIDAELADSPTAQAASRST